MPGPRPDPVADDITQALQRVDLEAVRTAYWRQHEFVYVEECLPRPLIERLVSEVDRVRPAVHRSYIPKRKKGGSVSYFTLREQAPATVALYRAPALVDFLGAVTGERLLLCPERDPHACALYFYTEPGDHIGAHYDSSYYKGARYTVLIGLIERSSSRLVCQPYRRDPGRTPVEITLATKPGTMVFFNGDTLWHWITPLGEKEERVSLTLEYVTSQDMSRVGRFVSDMKDAIAYFGFRSVLGGGRHRSGP